jgi:hypothetical protein
MNRKGKDKNDDNGIVQTAYKVPLMGKGASYGQKRGKARQESWWLAATFGLRFEASHKNLSFYR